MTAAREALGQLLAYRYLLHRNDPAVPLAALFNEFIGDLSAELLDAHEIAVIWWQGESWSGTQRARSAQLCQVVGTSV